MQDKGTRVALAIEAAVSAAVGVFIGRRLTVDELLTHLVILSREKSEMDAQTLKILTTVQADMAAQTSVMAGFATYTHSLQAQVLELKQQATNTGADPAVIAGLTSLHEMVTTNTATMAALTAGTAAATEPIPPGGATADGSATAGGTDATSSSAVSSASTGGATTTTDPPKSDAASSSSVAREPALA